MLGEHSAYDYLYSKMQKKSQTALLKLDAELTQQSLRISICLLPSPAPLESIAELLANLEVVTHSEKHC